jgi:threonine-phosphate decarboxylase
MTDSFFFFNSVAGTGMNASGFANRMLLNKIMVRDCSSFGAEFCDHVRFCVKDRTRNDRFIDAVGKITDGKVN